MVGGETVSFLFLPMERKAGTLRVLNRYRIAITGACFRRKLTCRRPSRQRKRNWVLGCIPEPLN